MQRINRLIGGILLVAGTATGAGMLALPVITSFGGFFPSLALFAFCWLFLFGTSWLLLDVNLSFPNPVNLISMAGQTLGVPGKMVCWLTYLLLLYSLTAAYIAGCSPLFLQAIAFATGWMPPAWAGPLPLLLLFGAVIVLATINPELLNLKIPGLTPVSQTQVPPANPPTQPPTPVGSPRFQCPANTATCWTDQRSCTIACGGTQCVTAALGACP